MNRRTWLDDEPPLHTAILQAIDLFRAGLGRRVVLAIATTVYAAALTGAVVLMKYSYAPAYILRVVESDADPSGIRSPKRQLAEYVRTAVFTSEPLLELIQRHGLYPSLARRNSRAALESFREDIEIEVRENYFVEQRPVGAGPRSARLIIQYHSADPEAAVSVTRDLGKLVVERERAIRSAEASRAVALARRQTGEAREALALRRSMVASMRAELDRDPTAAPERRIEYIGLLGSLPALELSQDEQERREAALALGAALEQQGAGLSFEVVDDGELPNGPEAKRARIVGAGTAFAFGVPLMTIGIGAFAPKRTRT